MFARDGVGEGVGDVVVLDHFRITSRSRGEIYQRRCGDGGFGACVGYVLGNGAEGCGEVDGFFGGAFGADLDDVFEGRAVGADAEDFLHADGIAYEDRSCGAVDAVFDVFVD